MQPAGILMTVSMQFDECESDALLESSDKVVSER
jgi:hypothetical protein